MSEASTVAARYTRAQELLATVRTQILLSSVRVRDAMLNPDPSSVDGYRDQIQAIQVVILKALDDYEPVLGLAAEQEQVKRMRDDLGLAAAIDASLRGLSSD